MNKGEMLEAEMAAQVIPATLLKRGLRAQFTDWLLCEYKGAAWLFGVLDVGKITRLEEFMRQDLLHHLSTAIQGKPVFLSNSSGLRYAVLISKPPRLPRSAAFPGPQRGWARLGLDVGGGDIATPWDKLGHLLVAGKTGAGKSMFLRLLVHQALGEGASLLLGDLDGRTFPMLAGHPALVEPVATTAEEMLALVERGLGECEARAALYELADGFPDSLSEYNTNAVRQGQATLPRVLVVLDEFNAAALATGGANSRLARAAAELGWRGRKFGVSLIFAAQDFTKAVVGRVRDQVGATVCFRVKSAEVARAVGCAEAVNIPESRPGMALTDRWGVMQAYFLDKNALITAAARPGPVLTDREAQAVTAARADGGRLTLALLQDHGYSRNAATRLLDDWKTRGWVIKDASQQNAHVLSDRFPPFPAFPTVSQVSQFPSPGGENNAE